MHLSAASLALLLCCGGCLLFMERPEIEVDSATVNIQVEGDPGAVLACMAACPTATLVIQGEVGDESFRAELDLALCAGTMLWNIDGIGGGAGGIVTLGPPAAEGL